jgi:hypothetical protein
MKKNKFIVDMKAIDLELLKEDIETMKAYLLLKFREQDWHGVADAAAIGGQWETHMVIA